jgi:hypothetical protein
VKTRLEEKRKALPQRTQRKFREFTAEAQRAQRKTDTFDFLTL